MFSKTIVALSLLFATASAGSIQCNTGTAFCCNTLQAPTTVDKQAIAALLGVGVQGVTGLLGASCTPITGIGAGQAANCAQQPACCDGRTLGLLNVQCVPVSV